MGIYGPTLARIDIVMKPATDATPPCVFDYLNHRTFLSDWFSHKQQVNPRYSHRLFARRAGLSNPSLLLLVMQGKRNLTDRTMDGVVSALNLDDDDAMFFRLIVEFEAAASDEKRNSIWAAIAATRRFRDARPLEMGAFELLSTWWVAATHELARLPEFEASASWVAAHLVPQIDESDAQHALDLLFELGLLVRHADSRVEPTNVSLTTPHEAGQLAVHNYHQGMIALGAQSMERTASDARHLGAVTAAIPRSLVPELKQELARFQEHILNLCDASEAPAEEVYQFNMQLFPLSRRSDG